MLTAILSSGVYSWNCHPLAETVHLFGNGTAGFPPYRFNWSFGDGSPTEPGQNVSHTYPGFQAHNVTLWVTDSHGGNASTEQIVSSAPPPCAAPRGPTVWDTTWPLFVGFGAFVVIAVVLISAVYLSGKRSQQGRPPTRGDP